MYISMCMLVAVTRTMVILWTAVVRLKKMKGRADYSQSLLIGLINHLVPGLHVTLC